MNPTILIADILNFAPEFNALNLGSPPTQLTSSLALFNAMADSVVQSPPFPGVATNGSIYTPIYMAKMFIICHWLKMGMNTEGRIASDKVGDLASTYATPNVNDSNDWNNSIYGQRYIQFRRMYAPGITHSPRPHNPPGGGYWGFV